MPRILKYLLLALTAVAVGTAQIVGGQASYFCECTGQKTVLESCVSSCHDGFHDHGECPDNHAEQDQHDEDTSPVEPGHEHAKVLQELVGTHTPPVLQTPSIIWVAVVTDPFPSLASMALVNPWPVAFDRKPPERETLPEGVLIARTTVMLV